MASYCPAGILYHAGQMCRSRRARERQRARRMWSCLVVEEDAAAVETAAATDGRHVGATATVILGYLLLSLSRPAALLPPPFPTTAPLQVGRQQRH